MKKATATVCDTQVAASLKDCTAGFLCCLLYRNLVNKFLIVYCYWKMFLLDSNKRLNFSSTMFLVPKPTSNSCLGTSQISFKAPSMAKIFQFLFMAKLVLVGIVIIGCCLVLLFLLYCAEVCNVLGGPITNLQVIAPRSISSFEKMS